MISAADVDELLIPRAGSGSLHGFIDEVQQRIAGFSEILGRDCFASGE